MKFRRILIPLAVLTLFAPVALAATTTNLSASLNSGTLSITPPTVTSAFPAIILDGQVQTVPATLSSWSVTDATGTGDGWYVTLSGSQFTEIAPSTGFASGTSALTLAKGSLQLGGSRSITTSSGSTPVSASGGPLFVNTSNVLDGQPPFTFVNTSQGYGLGIYTFNEPANGLLLTIDPATTDVDNINYANLPTPYSSTLTYSVVSGPAPSPITFSLVSGSSSLYASSGSTTTISGTLENNGVPLSGQTVNLSVTDGSLSASSVVTNSQGQFSATYTAGTTAGTSTVTASYSGVTASTSITLQSSTSSSLSATPTNLTFSSGTTLQTGWSESGSITNYPPGSSGSTLSYGWADPNGGGGLVNYQFTVAAGQSSTMSYGIPAGGFVNNGPVNIYLNGQLVATVSQDTGSAFSTASTTENLWSSTFTAGTYTLGFGYVSAPINVYGVWASNPSAVTPN